MRQVVAIGIDSGDPLLLGRLMDEGALPTLARLRRDGAYGRLGNLSYYRGESVWTMFLTGVHPERTGFWSPLVYRDYDVRHVGAYDFADFPPFYTQVPGARVAVFDVPQMRITPDFDGAQVVAWGAHSPLAPSASSPPALLADLVARHGTHPALTDDEAPAYDRPALLALRERLLEGLRRRGAITADLLGRERWDLFLTVVSEVHVAGHFLLHLSDPAHPLHAAMRCEGIDPIADVARGMDAAIGRILGAADPDAVVVVFSVHGMEPNSVDLPSMVFLPELMYRYSFPGRRGLAGADGAAVPRPAARLRRTCWEDELYAAKHDANGLRRRLRRHVPSSIFHRVERRLGWTTPPVCYRECSTLHYQPAWWYRAAWPEMRAFALPTFHEGYVRLNLAGREPHGTVSHDDYDRVCTEITDHLHALRDARSGRPIVDQVIRTRRDSRDGRHGRPDPDLIVSWAPVPTDVVDSPAFGRIGPVPFLRSGSHAERGFIMVSGPGIAAGSTLPDAHALDVPPTLLTLMGAGLPPSLDGQPIAIEQTGVALGV